MANRIGPNGYMDIIDPIAGPQRSIRIVSFTGAAAAGQVTGPPFPLNTSRRGLRAVIDINDGKNRTAEFSDTGCDTGNIHLSQLDTGPSGHVCWGIFSDTGT